MCLLAGCDYLPNVPGLGIKTAYKLVKQHRTYKKVSKVVVPDVPRRPLSSSFVSHVPAGYSLPLSSLR